MARLVLYLRLFTKQRDEISSKRCYREGIKLLYQIPNSQSVTMNMSHSVSLFFILFIFVVVSSGNAAEKEISNAAPRGWTPAIVHKSKFLFITSSQLR
jgi:hypothetical protein